MKRETETTRAQKVIQAIKAARITDEVHCYASYAMVPHDYTDASADKDLTMVGSYQATAQEG